MVIGQASKPKKAHGKMTVVDLESDIAKKGDRLVRLPRACFTFKMAFKFKPVVVTAVLICYPLFSVLKSYRPARLLRACFSLSKVLLSRVFL